MGTEDCGGRALLRAGPPRPVRAGALVLAPAACALLSALEAAPGRTPRAWRPVRDARSGGVRYARADAPLPNADDATLCPKLDVDALSDWSPRERTLLGVLVAATHGRVHAIADGLAAEGVRRSVADVRTALAMLAGVKLDAEAEARRAAALQRLLEHRPAELQAEQAALAAAIDDASRLAGPARDARQRLLALHGGGVAAQLQAACGPSMPEALGMTLAAAAAASGLRDPRAASKASDSADRKPRSHKKKKKPAAAPSAPAAAIASTAAAASPAETSRAERRPPPSAGPATYARSTRLAPVRGAPARTVDRLLAELGLPVPRVPTRAVMARFDALRAALAALVEAQRPVREADAARSSSLAAKRPR